MTINQTIAFLQKDKTQQHFARLYGNNKAVCAQQTERYTSLVKAFEKRFGDSDLRIFSSPGRSEISGNHTDHNLGKVLAASIQLDCIGAVTQTDDNFVTIYDLTYSEDYTLNTAGTNRIHNEKGSIALVRGILQGFKNAGYKTGGFKGVFTSDVIAAAGVSSSASFEMMICLILNNLFNNGSIPVSKIASIGQFAENTYWDKSSGLLDQMACATGGLISIDFKNPAAPGIEKIPFDFAKQEYSVIIVNTGKGHADLSREYSSIPSEMKAVASVAGLQTLRGLSADDITNRLPEIRSKCGDRAVLRAFHYIEENKRVDAMTAALKANDFNTFLHYITESGNSSWKWLQNTYVSSSAAEQQPIPVCLALTELFINKHCPKGSSKPGACRIHGGGFAGVILAMLPASLSALYRDYIHKALGIIAADKDPVYSMSIRPEGSIEITD